MLLREDRGPEEHTSRADIIVLEGGAISWILDVLRGVVSDLHVAQAGGPSRTVDAGGVVGRHAPLEIQICPGSREPGEGVVRGDAVDHRGRSARDLQPGDVAGDVN